MKSSTERELQHHRPEHAADGSASGGTQLGASWTSVVIVAVVVLAVLGRFLAHGMDRSRIRAYAEGNGWELLDCRWRLFAPGWIGNRYARFYDIRYRDAEGRTHAACAKTSALAGVYLTNDRVES